MAFGRIIKGIGGFYYILPENGDPVIECKARGKFRSEKITPMVGDEVEYLIPASGHAAVEKILPRKNVLVRPPVANIDQLLIVLSASCPAPDWLLVDKLIIQAELAHILPVLVLNKNDSADPDILSAFQKDYGKHFLCTFVSAKTEEGIDVLKDLLSGKISCFCGQSAVGKSTLINKLLPQLDLETGELARKTNRGRHTTRKAELWPCFDGAVLDTPGFSLFDPKLIEQDDLNRCYPEFRGLTSECRFPGCMHITEPGCAVRELVLSGGISKGRYERYKILAKDFEQRRKHRYD